MKLSAGIDLEPLRAQAREVINTKFASPPVSAIYALKAEDATREDCPDWLRDEAEMRGVNTHYLASVIVEKASEAKTSLLKVEAERQSRLKKVREATTQPELKAILKENTP